VLEIGVKQTTPAAAPSKPAAPSRKSRERRA
jgi:hypothetical protein